MKVFSLSLTVSPSRRRSSCLAALSLAAGILASSATAQTTAAQAAFARPETRITAKVDNSVRTTLAGNTHFLAKAEYDQGAVDPSTPMKRMILTLSHSAKQESALVSLLASQQDKGSPSYHQWLTPAQYGAQFGASDADIATITTWLTSQGFTVSNIGNGRNTIEFNGSAAQVTKAFQVPIHKYVIDGVTYQANASDPSIPTALTAAVRGVLSLHNFPRHPHHVVVGNFEKNLKTGAVTQLSGAVPLPGVASSMGAPALGSPDKPRPNFTFGETESGSVYEQYAVAPYDFATIYNLLPLWNAGIDGTGQSIAILQETNIHLDDVRAFRSLFGLPANDPVVVLNGPDPGVTAYDEGEADIDVEWSGATAKGAKILLVVSATTATTAGTDLSALYAVDNNIAPITSLSYGECELGLATAGNAFYNTLWQQGAAQGISHFVSTGDSGSAGCDNPDGTTAADFGLQVSGMASTPYNTAVGGTDFLGTAIAPNNFWSATNNATTQASALGYIPETTWDSDCTNLLFQKPFYNGGAGYGATTAAVCKSIGSAANQLIAPVGGSGGVSNCINGNGSTTSSCTQGYTKPSWQTGVGVPADAHRDIPDVAMFASSGFLGSYYVYCQEDSNADGKSCNVATASNSASTTEDFGGVGGTSVSTPAFAGIMAMVNQKTNARQGVANYVLYSLFNAQTTAGTACTSSYNNISVSGSVAVMPAAGCVFNDLTFGSNSSECVKNSPNCTTLSGNTSGVLTAAAPEVAGDGYLNTVGYDLAAGLGSVNATNLVNTWANVTFVPTTTTLALSATTFAHGTSENATITVAPTSGAQGTPTGNVELLTDTTPTSLGYVALTNGSVVGSFANFPGGTYTVSANYAGDGTYASSVSTPVSVTVTPENSTVTGTVYSVNESTGAETAATTLTYGGEVLIGMQVAGVSGQGTPTGSVTFLNNGSAFGTTTALNSAGQAGYDTSTLTPGSYSFTANYSGDASFNASSTTAAKTLTISKSGTKVTTAKGSTGTVAAGAPVTFTSTIVGNNATAVGNFGVSPTGTVSFYESATKSAVTGGTLMGTANITNSTTSATTGYISGIATLTVTPPSSTTGNSTEYYYTVYSGDTNYNTGSGALTTSLTVSQATKVATTNALSGSANGTYGSPLSVTSTISTTSSTLVPSGTVSFYVDGVLNGTAITVTGGAIGTPGTATASLTGFTGGAHTVSAIYSGDTNFLGSTGTLASTIAPVATQITLVGSTTAATQGTQITFTAAVPFTTAANPTGTMTFTVDGNVTGTGIGVNSFNTGGVGAYYNSNTLLPGTHTIGASYSGDKNYGASSNTTTVSISAAPQLILSTNQRSVIVLGAPVTINVLAEALNSGPTPTGSISYSVDGGPVTSNVGLTNGATSFVLTGLNELKHVVTVVYSGDGNYTSVSQTLTLNSDIAQTILFPNLPNTTIAAAPTFALAARSTSGLPVTYTVTGPATLTGSILTLTGPGSVSVTAAQAGNASFAAATSVTRSFTAQ